MTGAAPVSPGATAVGLSWPVIISGVGTGWATLLADGALAMAIVLYLWGVMTLRRRGRSWPAPRTAAAAAAVAVMFVAVGSGLASYDDDNFSAHVVQHVMLMMIAPPLAVAARPGTLALQALPGALRAHLRTALRVGSRRARNWPRATVLVFASVLYYGSMWACWFTPAYSLAERFDAFHDLEHVLLVLIGLAFWGLLSVRSVGAGAKLSAVLAGMPVEMYLGALLHGWDRSIGPGTTAASVRAGGEVFWWMAMLVSGTALAVLLGSLTAADERAARRLDAKQDRLTAVAAGQLPAVRPDRAANQGPAATAGRGEPARRLRKQAPVP